MKSKKGEQLLRTAGPALYAIPEVTQETLECYNLRLSRLQFSARKQCEAAGPSSGIALNRRGPELQNL